ncbi:MAG: cytochrome b [Paracoccaceae bacterium]
MSGWTNRPDSFGRISRSLHWLMALAILAMLVLGRTIATMEPGLSTLWLYGLHKSIGVTLLALALLRLVWHRFSPPPAPLPGPPPWQMRTARATHAAFYVLMVAVPASGWAASGATGLDVLIFDRWVLPPLAPVSQAWEDRLFALHGVLTKALALLVVLHVAAALKRQYRDRDGTLHRMLSGRARPRR